MDNKVILIHENGEYNVCINGNIIFTDKDFDNSVAKFKQVIYDNVIVKSDEWNTIEESLKGINDERLEVNREYKTISFGTIKYFYNTGKVFYTVNGQMTPLIGGYHLFNFIITMASAGFLNNYEELLEFCKEILKNKATYRTTESGFVVASAGFNYGSAEYNFISKKLNKGASIENSSFEDFKAYVLGVIKY